MALIAVLCLLVLKVSFLPEPATAVEPLFLINLCVDAIFLVDMVVNFFLIFQVLPEDAPLLVLLHSFAPLPCTTALHHCLAPLPYTIADFAPLLALLHCLAP